MESLYSSTSYFQSHIDGERSCPDFDNFIQKAESENSQLVRLLEEETQKTLALQKEFEVQNKQRDKHEQTSDELNEEAKQLHKRFLQNKETSESLKKTKVLLCEHEEELQRKFEMVSQGLEKLKGQNFEVIEKYQNTWKSYHAKYESTEMAGKLCGIKAAALKLENEVKDAAEKIAELKIQVTEAENEKIEMEDLLKQGMNSPKAAIINLAIMYMEISNTTNHVKEKLQEQHQLQKQAEQLAMEKERSIQRETEEVQQAHSAQAMECEPESFARADQPFVQTSPTTPSQHVIMTPSVINQEENSVPQPRMETNECIQQMSQGMAQATAPQISSPNVPVPGKILSTPISRQSVSSGRTFNINTSGLVGYKRIGTPIPASLPTTPPPQIILPRQQGNIDSMSAPSSRSNLITGNIFNTGTGRPVSTIQEQPTFISELGQIRECEMNDEQTGTSITTTTTTAKSPGPSHSSPNTPKTPTSVSQQGDFFNFDNYKEKIMNMSKSPGEGFSYHGRPMFGTIQEEEGSTDTATADTQNAYFQPFFNQRQQGMNDQFSATPTFFNMSNNKDQEEMAQPSNQFQPISSSNSTSLCSSLFAMSPGPTKESDQSTSVGFALFGDQPTSKHGNHGIQPLSPGFTFNFGGSPKIPDDRSMGQGGGAFNLF